MSCTESILFVMVRRDSLCHGHKGFFVSRSEGILCVTVRRDSLCHGQKGFFPSNFSSSLVGVESLPSRIQ